MGFFREILKIKLGSFPILIITHGRLIKLSLREYILELSCGESI